MILATVKKNSFTASTDNLSYEERLAIGEMKPINFDALREHANKVNSVPVVQMFQGTILTEETVSDVMIRRAQMLMYIQKKEVLPFAVDDHNREILRALKLYILKDERFETEGHGSLSKGIVLAGLQGCGKTMLLKMMADAGPVDYKHKGFVSSIADIIKSSWGDQMRFGLYHLKDIHSCVALEHDYRQKDGEQLINKIRTANKPMAFDDLGFEESSSMNFGNKINVMEHIIQARYNLHQDYGICSHFSTNIINGDELARIYGPRIRSRMREMCNWFYFDEVNHIDRRV
jgi:hypothetical protein